MKKVILFFILCLIVITLVNAEEVIIKINELEEDPGIFKRIFSANNIEKDITKDLNITHNFSSFNAFAAEVTKEQLKELKRNKKYQILENKQYHITLDTSIAQIDANDTWILQQNATNLTGTHQTICIIDTGVNYSHPNLGGCYGNNNASSTCKVLGGYDFINNDDDPMDDNGHGTHVAGIASSNDTTYRGVAPDSKIIAMKTMDSAGNGNTADLISAIEWCTNNATKFNITTISMSLGDDTYQNSYCNSSPEKDSVWSAIANNITVVAASGNCQNSTGSYPELCDTGISAPACIEGVIPVGGVNNADSILYQRGDLWQVLAPGSSITSTLYTGGFGDKSGTSMSAPHVAGAVAIIAQFFKLQSNQTLDNLTMIATVNQTDTEINDTANSGSIFPRLNLLRAIYSLDTIAPNVTLITPTNNSQSTNLNQTFTINITDLQLKNSTFFLWNSTSLVNQTSSSQIGQDTQYQITITNLTLGETYHWTLQAYDGNNITFTANNYTITISETTTTINSPTNNTFTNNNITNFSCTSQSTENQDLDNITFSIYNTTELINTTTTIISGTTNTTIFNYTLPTETNFLWNCLTTNNISSSSQTNNYTITYDITVPNLTITNAPSSVTSNSIAETFSFNISDNNEDTNCSLLFDGTIQTSKIITNYTITNNFTQTLTPATYNWKINCTDQAGNSNTSTQESFTITAVVVSSNGGSSSGSGSSGGGVSTLAIGTINNPILSPQLKIGYTDTYTKEKTVYFTITENHSITLNNIIENQVNITIRSTPITIIMEENTTKKFNLTNPQYLDLQVEVGVITATNAEITIKEIKEKNPNYTPSELEENRFSITQNETETPSQETKIKLLYTQYESEIQTISLITITILIAIYLFKHIHIKHKKHRKRKNIKKLLSSPKEE